MSPGGANHNDFSVVNEPPPVPTKAIVWNTPLLWQTHPYICDGLSVLQYWIGFPRWWQMNFYRQLCYWNHSYLQTTSIVRNCKAVCNCEAVYNCEEVCNYEVVCNYKVVCNYEVVCNYKVVCNCDVICKYEVVCKYELVCIPKYLDQFLMVLHVTFTTGLLFWRWSKQGVATICFGQNCTLS